MSVSNLTGTTWLISATPGYPNMKNMYANITFVSNSVVFTLMTVYGEVASEGIIVYRNNDTSVFEMVYEPPTWSLEAYRTIEITGGTDVTNSEVIEWLEDNAQQIVIVDDVVIKYQGDTIATMTASGTKTLLTADSYCENNIVVEYTKPSANLQAKTNITPTTSSQTITADSGYDGLSSVQINAMPSGSASTPATSITANPSISVSSGGLITATASASKSVTPTVSAGYVSSGTAGTVTVSGSNTSQLTTQAAQTITPTTTNQTITSGRYLTGTQTILGDANLVAGNIKNNVSIFGVTGTYGGGGTAQKTCTVTIDSAHVVCSNFSSGAPSGTYAAVFELPNSWDASNKQVGIFVACDGGVDSTDTNTNSALFVNDPSNPAFSGLVLGSQAYALAYNDDFLGGWVDSSYNTLGIVGTYTATVIEL